MSRKPPALFVFITRRNRPAAYGELNKIAVPFETIVEVMPTTSSRTPGSSRFCHLVMVNKAGLWLFLTTLMVLVSACSLFFQILAVTHTVGVGKRNFKKEGVSLRPLRHRVIVTTNHLPSHKPSDEVYRCPCFRSSRMPLAPDWTEGTRVKSIP